MLTCGVNVCQVWGWGALPQFGGPPEPEVLVLFLGGLDFVAEAFDALAVGVFGLAIA